MAVAEDAGKTAQKADEKIELIFERTGEFITPERQERVNKILEMISGLRDEVAINLAKNPPVSDPKTEELIKLMDPPNRRFTDPKVAREILKVRATMSKRNKENMDAWEAALKAVQ
jgi:hypothetical protein